MALLPCPECARDISTRADTCPHCGCPVAETVVAEARRSGASPAELRALQPAPGSHGARPASTALGRCAACGADDVRRVAVVYEAGTYVGLDFGFAPGARVPVVTPQVRQVPLAARLRPPKPEPTANPEAVMLGAAAAAVAVGAGAGLFGEAGVVGGGVLALLGLWTATARGAFEDREAVARNAREWPSRLARWRRLVVCMRCSALTDPENPTALTG